MSNKLFLVYIIRHNNRIVASPLIVHFFRLFRVNQPSTPPRMLNSVSSNDLGKAVLNGNCLVVSAESGELNGMKMNSIPPAYSPSKHSREGSIEGEDLVYASVQGMSQGKCGVGAEIYVV